MYLPPTPTNLKLARNIAFSGPAPQKVDGISFAEMPAPVSHLPEPLQVTPALDSRCAIVAAAWGSGVIDPDILMGQRFTADFSTRTLVNPSANPSEVSHVSSVVPFQRRG